MRPPFPAANTPAKPDGQAVLWDRALRPHGWLKGLAVVAACSAISALMEPHFDQADLIMVYMAGVLFVALQYGQRASVLAVVASIVAFDLIFVAPRWGLNPDNPKHIFSLLVMLVASLVISRLALRVRQQRQVADGQARSAMALNQLAQALASARSEDTIADSLATALRATFDMPCALLLLGEQDQLRDPTGFCRHPVSGQDELPLAQRQLWTPPEVSQAPPATGTLFFPLQGTGAPLGVLAIRPPADWRGSADEHHLLRGFANQAALAIERLVFERKSAAAAVEVETERLRNTVLSGISHDFRTPLTTIVGAATSLQTQDRLLDGPRRHALVNSILNEARRMHALVSDLLDISRLEDGAVPLGYEWCPADELVAEASDTVRPRLGSHQLHTEVPPDAVVWCDPRLVVQALVNLLDNALRHTPPGSAVRVRVVLHDNHWQLVVADNGPGVPPGHERDVFKKFYRGRNEPTGGAGTGLGLAICMAVARLHKGHMGVRNDGGACFEMTFPQPRQQARPLDEAA